MCACHTTRDVVSCIQVSYACCYCPAGRAKKVRTTYRAVVPTWPSSKFARLVHNVFLSARKGIITLDDALWYMIVYNLKKQKRAGDIV